MPTRTLTERMRTFLDPRPAKWRTVVALGVVLAYADGYVLVALTGAVGAIERTDHPFSAWLEESAVLVPFFVLAELLVLGFIRRRTGPVARTRKAVLVSALLIAVAATFTGTLAITASAAYDFSLQTKLIDFDGQFMDQNGDPLVTAGSTVARGNCNSMICDEQRFSLATDIRGVGIGVPILLALNLIMIGWVLAFFGGRLGAPVRRSAGPPAAAVPASTGEKV
jgi:hypothetical protein